MSVATGTGHEGGDWGPSLQETSEWADSVEDAAVRKGRDWQDSLQIMAEARLIGGALITLALIAIVLNEVLTASAFNNSTGPFSSFLDDLETTGVAAMGLLVIGLLVVAANAILGRFGGGF